MTSSFQDHLSELFREIEIDIGATQLSIMALKSLREALRNFKGNNHHDFFEQLAELTKSIRNTEPKIAILMDSFHEVLATAVQEELHDPKGDHPLKKRMFLKKLAELIRRRQEKEKEIISQASHIEIEGREILVHDSSRTVLKILMHFKRQGKHFRVLVAEQDPVKTNAIIETLHERQIPFRVVPSYMIMHMAEHIDIAFMGGLTLKSTMDFVMDPGTNALVSQLHLMKRPIYVFMPTAKFSMWKAKKRTEVYAHVHRRKHHSKPIDFERIKFSHDRVELKFITKVVTEQGIFTPGQVENFYKKKKRNYQKQEREFKAAFRKVK